MSEVVNAAKILVEISNSQVWSCDACTFINLPTNHICEMCETPLPREKSMRVSKKPNRFVAQNATAHNKILKHH